jgi:hypothetical protein
MRCTLLTAIVFATALAAAEPDQSWTRPLAEKEKALEANILQRHNILGLYPSMVEIPADGGAIDITTTNPFADIQHAVCWTANYLAGASYRYAFLKKSGAPADEVAAAKKRADELFEAVYRCQRVTGRRGLQARGYLLGHGEVYAERQSGGKLPYWRQGEVDGQAFRWVGDPSHHNYSDSIHGLGQYYDLAAEDEQKDRCREAIDALVSYWVDNDLKIDKFDRTLPSVPILGMTDGKTLNMRIMMAIAGAKVAHHATGNEKFKVAYDRLIDQYGVRGLQRFATEKDFDDAEHVFSHLDNLFRIEDDPELLAAYRALADSLWANHKDDAQSLFSYIYCAIAPDTPDKDKALTEALHSLQTWPTDMTVRPRMTSLNKELKPPYPVYAAAWDNEYMWKGNLLRADGWHGRAVTDVAVPVEDPMVLYAVDAAGGLYKSRDGATTVAGWEPVEGGLASPVRAVDAGPRARMVYVACADGFHLSTTGGHSWTHMPVPFDGTPVDIVADPALPWILYATTDRAVYRSRDFGEKFLGQKWDSLTDGLPAAATMRFAVAPGAAGRVYAILDNTLFTRRLDEDTWLQGGQIGFPDQTRIYPWLATDPSQPDHAIVGLWTEFGGMGTLSMLQQSTDHGVNWSPGIKDIYQKYSEGGMMGLMPLFIRGKIGAVVIDPDTPATMYAAGDTRGVLKSTDGGVAWQDMKTGLDIPLVRTVMAPRNTDWVFAGTPGGLFVSKDGADTWEDANLWLQFGKNTRRELGGAAFIDAYWRARYYGFIDDATAMAPYEGK